VTRRAWILVAALCVIGAVGALVLRVVLVPKPFAVVQTEPARRPVESHAPGRTLRPPANHAPESVVRAVLGPKTTPVELPGAREGTVTTLTITTPVFEIDRPYRSMEGPHAEYDVRVDAGGKRAGPADGGPAAGADPPELLWWKGARIEVLDEGGAPLGQEFMCHLNVNVDPKARGRLLGLEPGSARMLTLTQGELSFALPRGHAVPVSSTESWNFMFQVLNHNRQGRFRVKQRLTLYFVRDADLFAPIDPLTWFAGSLWVPLDRSNDDARTLDDKACHCCVPLGRGLEATNNVMAGRLVDEAGRTLVGHWVVPPGTSTWAYPLTRHVPIPSKDLRLYATWTHVHPFAKEVRLVAHAPGCAPRIVTRSAIESEEAIVGLRAIHSLASSEGEVLPAGATFELAVDYDNTSGRAQDSMTSLGMFVGADDWKRPLWAARAQDKPDMDSCGLPP
jgi:hypothetical protein